MITAKQMKKLAKEQAKKRKAEERQQKENATSNFTIIQEILNNIKDNPDALKSRYFLIYSPYYRDDVGDTIRELNKNFEAYERDFRKLGYRLTPAHDTMGTGYGISW